MCWACFVPRRFFLINSCVSDVEEMLQTLKLKRGHPEEAMNEFVSVVRVAVEAALREYRVPQPAAAALRCVPKSMNGRSFSRRTETATSELVSYLFRLELVTSSPFAWLCCRERTRYFQIVRSDTIWTSCHSHNHGLVLSSAGLSRCPFAILLEPRCACFWISPMVVCVV